MYKISPVLTEYQIKDEGLVYKIKPIQTVGSTTDSQATMQTLETEQDIIFEQLNQLSNRVNTVLNVLSKSAASGGPKTTHGIKFVEKNAPLDVVVNVHPQHGKPSGLITLHKKLCERFSCETKVFTHSSAAQMKHPDWFESSKPAEKATRRQFQLILTIIYTTSVPEITCYAGNAKLTGCSTVMRFIGRLLDIYPVEGKQEAVVEEWIEIADIIADPETNKKERMVQAKSFGVHLGKNKFICGNSATLADHAMFSAIQTVEAKTYSDSVKKFCAAMEQL